MGLDKYIIINSKYLHKQFYKNLSFCYISKSNEEDPIIMFASIQHTLKNLWKRKNNHYTNNKFTTFYVFNVYKMFP